MSLEKINGQWYLDIQPGGRGHPRIRKTFRTRREAELFEAHVLSSQISGKPWLPERKDYRRLSDLVEAWYTWHGFSLRDGVNRKSQLLMISRRLGNPLARKFAAVDFVNYRSDWSAKGLSANTLNHHHAYLRAMFAYLIDVKDFKGENPLDSVSTLTVVDKELTFLTELQLSILLDFLLRSRNDSVYDVSRLALVTGARFSEAEKLLSSDLVLPNMVRYLGKNGKYRNIPVSDEIWNMLLQRAKVAGRSGRLFSDCYNAFRYAVGLADIHLPRGQLTHILRHSFASAFMQKGGNILSLQRILDHSDLKITMRYAHLAPGHFEECLRLNPLSDGSFLS